MDKFDLKNVSVLIIDDYAPMRKLVMSLLRELGIMRLSQAPSGEAALKVMKEFEPDIILADAIMEPMDGLEFTRKIREGEAGINPFVPIIMISGQAETRHILKARDAGVTEFLAKPISARAIYTRLCTVINNPRPFIRTPQFFGPDRRRIEAPFEGDDRRSKPHVYSKGDSKGGDDTEAWPDQEVGRKDTRGLPSGVTAAKPKAGGKAN
jgi:CheY-like chemotaxis protein